jgi:hypothetical protein
MCLMATKSPERGSFPIDHKIQRSQRPRHLKTITTFVFGISPIISRLMQEQKVQLVQVTAAPTPRPPHTHKSQPKLPCESLPSTHATRCSARRGAAAGAGAEAKRQRVVRQKNRRSYFKASKKHASMCRVTPAASFACRLWETLLLFVLVTRVQRALAEATRKETWPFMVSFLAVGALYVSSLHLRPCFFS